MQETSFSQTLAAVGLARVGLVPLPISKAKHQPTPHPGREPARAAQHSLRLLQGTSFGETLAAVGSARAGLVLLPISKSRIDGTTTDLATGRPTGPPGIKIEQNPQIHFLNLDMHGPSGQPGRLRGVI